MGILLQENLTTAIVINPYIGKPLKGDLKGLYSYRLNQTRSSRL
jgi:toxin YoeB